MRAMSHSPRAPVHVPEIRVTAQQAHFAVHLFSVWFIVTFVLVLLALLFHFLVYPLLCNPSLPDYVQDVIGDCKSVIRFIRRSLRNHR